jgi:hypothetical protein
VVRHKGDVKQVDDDEPRRIVGTPEWRARRKLKVRDKFIRSRSVSRPPYMVTGFASVQQRNAFLICFQGLIQFPRYVEGKLWFYGDDRPSVSLWGTLVSSLSLCPTIGCRIYGHAATYSVKLLSRRELLRPTFRVWDTASLP